MKKILSSLAVITALSVSANAVSIDENSVKTYFVGFKLAKKQGVKGEINNAKYNFATTEGSVVQILNGITATMDFKDESTKDKIRDKNIQRTYIANLADSKISASLKDAKGSDVNGTAIGVITFNNVTKEIPVSYDVADGKLRVKGEVNIRTDFNSEEAYIALSTDKQISALHGKKTWEEAEFYFDIDVK